LEEGCTVIEGPAGASASARAGTTSNAAETTTITPLPGTGANSMRSVGRSAQQRQGEAGDRIDPAGTLTCPVGELGAFLKIHRVGFDKRDPRRRVGDYRQYFELQPAEELSRRTRMHWLLKTKMGVGAGYLVLLTGCVALWVRHSGQAVAHLRAGSLRGGHLAGRRLADRPGEPAE